jgi:hypothetical protein
LTIGFRHQTYYDFTIARSFGRGARSLSTEVLARQDGLFVRPSLISGLHYLRAAARSEYQKQLSLLMCSQLRLHLRSLIIEILGEQSEPDDFETNLMIPLLDSEDEGPRVLRAIASSKGWFGRVKRTEIFLKWLSKPPDKAAHCVPLFSAAMGHYPEVCSELVERFWIHNEAYDSLSLAVLQERKDWDHHGVGLVCRIARRTQLPWFVESLAERVADSAPAEAPFIIRADFERRLENALKQADPIPELPLHADRQQRLMHALTYERKRPLKQLIENSQTWHNLEEFARRAPKAFLNQLWPWFLNVVSQMAEDEHEFVVRYRRDPTSYRSFEGDLQPAPIVRALLTAITELASIDKDGFVQFLTDNLSSEFLIVHRLLSRGLEELASEDPAVGLEYLSSDPRRLALGDMHDARLETERLIRVLATQLDKKGIQELEEIIVRLSGYKRIPPELSPEERFERLQRDRRNRLRFLRAIPLERLSADAKKLRAEEELIFVEPDSREERGTGSLSGVVGPRITVKEMVLASDENLLKLFDELPDSVGWDNPKRTWSRDMSRSGGAIQLSRELGELAKQAPTRVFALTARLQPGIHEQYAGEAIKGIANTEMPPAAIISLIEELDNRGFHSKDFRSDVSSAAETLAGRNKGLSDTFLQRLELWLAEEAEPIWPDTTNFETKNDEEDRTSSILWGSGTMSFLTHGRGSITRTIAAGYLQRNPPDIEGWRGFIQSRLGKEKHPKIWSEILIRMPVLFQADHCHATSLFDKVIQACPEVLEYPFAIYAIAQVLRGIDPKEVGESWLESLLANGSPFCRQAYGELLPLFNCIHQDESSTDRLRRHLEGDRSPDIDLGLTFAATHLWSSQPCREIATQILCLISASEYDSVQRAIASIFRLTLDYFELDVHMRTLIDKVASNPSLLLFAAEDLIQALEPITATEPTIVSRVCADIIKFGREQINKPGTSWVSVADKLTNIALTLHRQTASREAGLQLFEQLIALNVREAKDAIEVLDRRPIVPGGRQHRARWRPKVRRVRRTS